MDRAVVGDYLQFLRDWCSVKVEAEREAVSSQCSAIVGVACSAGSLFIIPFMCANYWKEAWLVWCVLSGAASLIVAVGGKSYSLRVAALLGWGLTIAWIGLLLCVDIQPAPAQFDDRWILLIVGWPFRRIRLAKERDVTDFGMGARDRFEIYNVLSWDMNLLWLVCNYFVGIALADVVRRSMSRWPRMFAICGICLGVAMTRVAASWLWYTTSAG